MNLIKRNNLACRMAAAAGCLLVMVSTAHAFNNAGALAARYESSPYLVEEGGLGENWDIASGTTLAAPGYPERFIGRDGSTCLAMMYTVSPDGRTSDYLMLRGWNSKTGTREPVEGYWEVFAQSAAQSISQWRFEPRDGRKVNRDSVTVSTFVFTNGKVDESKAAVRSHCEVDNLASELRRVNRTMVRGFVAGDQQNWRPRAPSDHTPMSIHDMPPGWPPGKPTPGK